MFGSAWTAAVKAAPVRLWALIGAGPPLTLFCWGLVAIVWKGPWPQALASQQLTILGYALYIGLALIAVIVIALAAVKVKGAALGGSFEVDADDPPPAGATATASVTLEPGRAQ